MSLSLAIWSRAHFGLGAGEPRNQRARHLADAGALVDAGGAQRIRLDTGLREKHEAARACACEHELGLFARSILPGLLARELPAQRLAPRTVGPAEAGVRKAAFMELMMIERGCWMSGRAIRRDMGRYKAEGRVGHMSGNGTPARMRAKAGNRQHRR